MSTNQGSSLNAAINRQASALIIPAYRLQAAGFRARFYRLDCSLRIEHPSPFKVRLHVSDVLEIWDTALKIDNNMRRTMDAQTFESIKDEIRQWAEYRRDIAYKAIQFFTENSDCYKDISPFMQLEMMIPKEIKFIHKL